MSETATTHRLPVSYSGGKLFEECPARFKAEKIDHIRGERPIHLMTGVFLHEVTEAYLKHLQRAQQSHDFAYADRVFGEFWDSKPAEIPEATHEELKEVWDQIRTHLVMPRVDEMVEAELKISLRDDWTRTTWDAPDAWLRMKIDRLDATSGWHLRIWDLKTGHKIETPEESKQGKVYAAAVQKLFPQAASITFELYYPRFNTSKEYVFQPKDMEEGARWITAISNRIEEARRQDRWQATPGGACMDCPIFYDCEKRKQSRSVQPPRDKDQADALFEHLLLVERERVDLQEAIKTWIDANGPLENNGMLVGYTLTERLEFPIDQLYPILLKRGIDPVKVLKAESKKLERFAKRDDAFRKDLELITVNKSTTTFKIKRSGAKDEN